MSGDALKRQIGGAHYKQGAIQPVEFWQRNGWDGCACSTLKYLDRHRRKNGLEDVQKAAHYVELRQALPVLVQPRMEISMQTFIAANGITDPLDVAALQQLEIYVHCSPHRRHLAAATLIKDIEALAATYCAA